MRNSETHLSGVSEGYRALSADAFGESSPTGAELAALLALRKSTGSREATLRAISKDGYPLPTQITPQMVGLAGAAHGCRRTEHLAAERGPDGSRETYLSYTTKNQFDRFVRKHLPQELLPEWSAAQDDTGMLDNSYATPKGIDPSRNYGGSLPHRIGPATAVRYLESARLGWISPSDEESLLITDETDRSQYTLQWDEFIPGIQAARSIEELTGSMQETVLDRLRSNSMSDAQIAAFRNMVYEDGAEDTSIRSAPTEHDFEREGFSGDWYIRSDEAKGVNALMIHVHGRHPAKRILEGNTRHYVVLNGEGTFSLNGVIHDVKEGDMITIEPGGEYEYQGNMRLFEFNISPNNTFGDERLE
ncbi:MAG: hypothetical protein AAF413_04460 [Patescibacteria group bacterium]